jgi:hypothetical protein
LALPVPLKRFVLAVKVHVTSRLQQEPLQIVLAALLAAVVMAVTVGRAPNMRKMTTSNFVSSVSLWTQYFVVYMGSAVMKFERYQPSRGGKIDVPGCQMRIDVQSDDNIAGVLLICCN